MPRACRGEGRRRRSKSIAKNGRGKEACEQPTHVRKAHAVEVKSISQGKEEDASRASERDQARRRDGRRGGE